MSETEALIPIETIERRILMIRGQKVMLNDDLAELYAVEPRSLIQAVKRNIERFPEDFLFQLTKQEVMNLKSQIVISNGVSTLNISNNLQLLDNMSKTGLLRGRGGRRHYPYAFTEQGVAMLSSVLNSRRAVIVNIEIMRAFVKMRQLIASHADLARKLDELEKRYDSNFKIVFDAIREMMTPREGKKKKIGFDLGKIQTVRR